MRFFVGIEDAYQARHFSRAFLSVNRLRRRKSDFEANDWILDSGAFTEIATHGRYRHGVGEYAEQIRRWARCGNLLAAVAQDFMCEAWILEKTGLTIADHQRMTVERYDQLLGCETGVYIMPVLQGFDPADYVSHIRQYGDRLAPGMHVGVGSVCKRNGDPASILRVLGAIKAERPDLRLHGFGVKSTSLSCRAIVDLLETADSMAWSYAARKQGRDPHDIAEARRFAERIDGYLAAPMRGVQLDLFADIPC